MSVNEIESKVMELRELRRMREDLAAEIASIEDSLKDHMDTHGMDTLLGRETSRLVIKS